MNWLPKSLYSNKEYILTIWLSRGSAEILKGNAKIEYKWGIVV